jgi:type IV secretory pathway TraG/TraD family ATPase VirD4
MFLRARLKSLAGLGGSRSVAGMNGPHRHHRRLTPRYWRPAQLVLLALLVYWLTVFILSHMPAWLADLLIVFALSHIPGWLAYTLIALAFLLGHIPGWLQILGAIYIWQKWHSGSTLLDAPLGALRDILERLGLRAARTWATPYDLRRLWVPGPTPGRPYLGWTGKVSKRMLAAEPEIQTLLVAPPRSGKSNGYVIPWLLDHTGPALVSSTKRDIYDATIAYRQGIGDVWVYDPFGEQPSCSYSPLSTTGTWEGALRAANALASAAHPTQASSAGEFWDREAASLLAPLLYAATLAQQRMDAVLEWLDTRDFETAEQHLQDTGAHAAAAQLRGVTARDPRNRETTIMSATSLLRAYRYPTLAQPNTNELTPAAFLNGNPNTIYIVAAAHHQQDLQPVLLALINAIYEAAIDASRHHGPLNPALYMLLDEAANIAPVKDLAPWLSQCGDHGITIATSWQSIAQIEERYGHPGRDAILAASTAQIYLPPLADPTTTHYITNLLGEEPVTHVSHTPEHQHLHIRTQEKKQDGKLPPPITIPIPRTQKTYSVTERPIATSQWLRQTKPGNALLVYRDLPPAILHTPLWFSDPRYAKYAKYVSKSQ